jgi:8-oxo-dGTP diphosphatase/2-hydroxy-dATP diphosphatase
MKKVLTLCVIHEHQRVLLGMKKRGFGAGRWNGFGGKMKEGETVEEAALRELQEESGIGVKNIERIGIIDFEFSGNQEVLEVHVFKGSEIKGEPQESEEMKPKWFSIEEIPFGKMWPDDRHWFPLFLQGKKFKGKFLFDKSDRILDMSLAEA